MSSWLELVAAVGVVMNGLTAQLLAYLASKHALSVLPATPTAKV